MRRLTILLAITFLGVINFSFVYAKDVFLHSNNLIAQWKLKPQADLSGQEEKMMKLDYDASSWVDAVVPGTVFNSYVQAGYEEDPNWGDNIQKVERSKYDRNFWYRTEFMIPEDFNKETIWLNFDGVNRKAEIYLNGFFLGTLDGFMHRGRFDITNIVSRNKKNVLAVLVYIPQTPLANQGSPTYLSSAGWDWMPYVPGLNSGITDKVYLSNTGNVILVDPWIRTDLPTRSRADLAINMEVKNNACQKERVVVKGVITPGRIEFQKEIEIDSKGKVTINLDKRYFPQLSIHRPKLWWPNGYGEANLYQCHLEVWSDEKLSDVKNVTFGIKKYSYDKKDNTFHIYVNGVPIFVKGANWGMSEYLLRCRGEEYDTKIRLHKEMNFNMIRNWLGSTTDDEFYQYCDKYGIMVWDDFWINSNPNLPYDLNAFNNNMIEKIKRVRNHPCIAVWCGDNEANPQPPLEGWMRENVKTFDGGDRYFQANSHAQGLTGSGPWGALNPKDYFMKYPDGLEGDPARGWGFRTEIGTAVVPAFESLKKFMPKQHWWPIDKMWDLHYFGSSAFNATPDRYKQTIAKKFGEPVGVEDFCKKAQLINIEANKAMYEGWLDRMWEDASGIMLWMGQSAYPSMVWQTYDYYYDLTGAYWGCKSACEPLHIFWNPVTDEVKVSNTTARDVQDLTAEVMIYNKDGKPVKRYSKSVVLDAASNTSTQCFLIDFNKKRRILSLGKPAYASSTEYGDAKMVTDGKLDTRWASVSKKDNEWIYVDLGSVQSVGGVRLHWEASYGKAYKIQVSNDAKDWKEVYKTDEGTGGIEEILFSEVDARYVRLFGIERGWWFGYSLWSIDVLGATEPSEDLSDVHFIRLKLKDKEGEIISENTYWRSNYSLDFTAMNDLPSASSLDISTKLEKKNGKALVRASITQPDSALGVAFAIHVQLVRASDGERILPVVMNDNYFTLMPGETKHLAIEFDEKLLGGGDYKLLVEPYNH